MRFLSLVMAAAVTLIASGCGKPSNDIASTKVDVSQVQFTNGNTQYQVNGQTVQAYVTLQGNSGYYQTSGGSGQFYNVRYVQGPTTVNVFGTWSFGGQSGTFQWYVGYDGSIIGTWGTGSSYQNGGSWTGSLQLRGGGNQGGGQPCGFPGGPMCPNNGGGQPCGFPGGPMCPSNGGGQPCGFPGGPMCPSNGGGQPCGFPGGPMCPSNGGGQPCGIPGGPMC